MISSKAVSVVIMSIILIFIIAAFLIGFYINPYPPVCTEKYCECVDNGEFFCNSCSIENPVFLSGLVNVYKVCSAKEVIVCTSEERRVRVDEEGGCEYKGEFFKFVVRAS